MKIKRLPINPIIVPDMDARMGDNINGPSLIRVPDWIANPLGQYYLYFSHHGGKYIRLAYADNLTGPWSIHEPGVLDLCDSHFEHHIASPDVHVDHAERRIRMYYHGCVPETGRQRTRIALSSDGLRFDAKPDILGGAYFRVWQWDGWYYAFSRDGHVYRSSDPLAPFEEGHRVFSDSFRHSAVAQLPGSEHLLHVFASYIGDNPEHIRRCILDQRTDWTQWSPPIPETVLLPVEPWEGTDLPRDPSTGGWSPDPVHQVRDPDLYEEDGRWYLLYTVAGEYGIAIAEIEKW
jgi:hypothetical protein